MAMNYQDSKVKHTNTNKNIFVGVGIALLLIFFASTLGQMWPKLSERSLNIFGLFEQSADNTSQNDGVIRIVSEESQVIDVVKKTTPAVLSIVASAEVPRLEVCYRENSPFGQEQFFDDFFNFQIPYYCERGTETKRVGAGSGFLASADGYIITNKHVVSNEEAEYTVILNNDENRDEKVIARVVAKDPVNDIAILKIEKTDLPFLELGDSEKLQVGQTAIAIGYALGEFDNTVSKGVVSGLARNITAGGSSSGVSEQLEGVIQTDAAINPGNSGGPLVDISGKVIGMNVAMASGQNIGFAIPINEVRKVYEDVKETGKIQRAFLGVRYLAINEQLQEKNNLPYNHGALIIRGETESDLAVVPGSAADKAGLVENDIILEINGVKIDQNNSLSKLINSSKIGENIKLKVYHKGSEKEVSVNLEERQ